jgi:hypothetical protein
MISFLVFNIQLFLQIQLLCTMYCIHIMTLLLDIAHIHVEHTTLVRSSMPCFEGIFLLHERSHARTFFTRDLILINLKHTIGDTIAVRAFSPFFTPLMTDLPKLAFCLYI